MSKKRREELRKALTAAIAAINVVNTMAPIGVQYAAMTKEVARSIDFEKPRQVAYELIENGDNILLLFINYTQSLSFNAISVRLT